MPDLEVKHIKKLKNELHIFYQGYNIFVEIDGHLITLRICSNDEKIEIMKIIKDKDYNETLLKFINIMLKPYIDVCLSDIKDIESNL